MINLLEETIEVLKENGKTTEDVLWVGDTTLHFSWEHFVSIADREYDSGFGGEEVLKRLLVVGDGWWLERHSYDGSEWWEYKSLPEKPTTEMGFSSVFYWDFDDTDLYDYVWRGDTFQEILDKKIEPTTQQSLDKGDEE